MVRRALKKNPALDEAIESQIKALRNIHPKELEETLREHDYPGVLELRGPGRREALESLRAELSDISEAHRRSRRAAGEGDQPAGWGTLKDRPRAKESPGGSLKATAEKQRQYRKEAQAAAERPLGPANVVIRKAYRGYSYELEEVAPGKWDIRVIFEPISMHPGQPSVKGAVFEAFADPDDASIRVKREIDEVLSWYAARGISPSKTAAKRPAAKSAQERALEKAAADEASKRRVASPAGIERAAARRGRRHQEESEAAGARARGHRSARVERIRGYEELGYDPRAGKKDNVDRMKARIEELRDEMRVTRDGSARQEMADTVDQIRSMVKRLEAGKEAIKKGSSKTRGPLFSKRDLELAESYGEQTSKGRKNPRKKPKKGRKLPKELPPGTKITRVPPGKAELDQSYREVGGYGVTAVPAHWQKLAGNPKKKAKKARRKRNPSFWQAIGGSSNDAVLSMARSSERDFDKLIGKWVRSRGRKNPDFVSLFEAYDAAENARANYFLAEAMEDERRLGVIKADIREGIIDILEAGGLRAAPITVKGSSKKKNPESAAHLKTGKACLKKSETLWERYYKKGSRKDLIDAYKYMVLAHEELKYGGDKKGLAQVKKGMKAAEAELKG